MRHDRDRIFERSLAVARRVLPFMGRNRISATPKNYMIFYVYFEGDSDVVREVVDEQLDSGRSWTDATTSKVFNRLFSSEANIDLYRLNEKLAGEIKEMTSQVIKETKETADKAEKSNQALGQALEESDKLAESDKLVEVVQVTEWLKSAVHEISKVRDANLSLGQSLTAKSEHLEQIVDSLNKIENMVLTDELTGLANRRAWESRLETEFERFTRYDTPCVIIMLDIDDFKKVNDTFGHMVGDRALVELAKILGQVPRIVDFAARIGGEEFTCLLPETPMEGGMIAAERLRKSLSLANFKVRGQPVSITGSFGVATFRKDDESSWQVMERVDAAMYLAKHKGKNQVRREEELNDYPEIMCMCSDDQPEETKAEEE